MRHLGVCVGFRALRRGVGGLRMRELARGSNRGPIDDV